MFNIRSNLFVIDNCGIKWVKCISKKKLKTGFFFLSVILNYKIIKNNNRNSKFLSLICLSRFWNSRYDGCFIKFSFNGCLLCDKDNFKIIGTEIFTIGAKELFLFYNNNKLFYNVYNKIYELNYNVI